MQAISGETESSGVAGGDYASGRHESFFSITAGRWLGVGKTLPAPTKKLVGSAIDTYYRGN